jgi:S1-C subfamily serine protease
MCESASARGSAVARPNDGRVRVVVVERSGSDRLASPGFSIDWSHVTARVLTIDPQGPAAAAEIAAGDVITSVDDTSVREPSADVVAILIGGREPGSTSTDCPERVTA